MDRERRSLEYAIYDAQLKEAKCAADPPPHRPAPAGRAGRGVGP